MLFDDQLKQNIDQVQQYHEAYGIPQIDYVIQNERMTKQVQKEILLFVKLNRLYFEKRT